MTQLWQAEASSRLIFPSLTLPSSKPIFLDKAIRPLGRSPDDSILTLPQPTLLSLLQGNQSASSKASLAASSARSRKRQRCRKAPTLAAVAERRASKKRNKTSRKRWVQESFPPLSLLQLQL